MRDNSVRLHEQLSIDNLEVMNGIGCIQFRLPIDKKKFIDWKVSKRLLPGSLIVTSPDLFKSFFVGIVRNRDTEEMNYTHKKYGYVAINIEIIKSTVDLGSMHEIISHFAYESFQMIESSAYFESYLHVLNKLKLMDTWPEMPLSRYYVKGN